MENVCALAGASNQGSSTIASDTPQEPFTSKKRQMCELCGRPRNICLCDTIAPLPSVPRFGILTHPREARKVQNTGRLAHLCLTNSVYCEGVDFTEDATVNEVLADPRLVSYILYPDENAMDLSIMSSTEIWEVFGERAMFWVVDGTWNNAGKMIRESNNLKDLPKVAFSPPQQSRFAIRKQPKEFCYSSIESIAYIIDRFSCRNGLVTTDSSKQADLLMRVFMRMVDMQIECEENRRLSHQSSVSTNHIEYDTPDV
ncbi:hypothetical protein CYMTET_31942 [Cymbomonas tetramitiformis]|uniref:tRNA-uridine aminocarboxypropyltransferase n=1 Tax=Cymbomonas tetramitiformis TaxID=36881 RepID=A0AAE0FGS8_9CHLO|nr:hypothetical protein CYMTET_31942 [Cymbomonas tetramitiformis]